MKVEITEKGVYDAKGKPIAVGTEITVKGDILPGFLIGKCRVIGEKAAKAQAITNPVKTKERMDLEAQADAAKVAYSDEMSDEDLISAIKAAKPE